MINLRPFLPVDRLDALARRRAFDDRVAGAALVADVSGFTLLASALAGALGPQRGAEELTRYLNLVYRALVGEVDRYGGSVIGFSGDAITCWFDAGRDDAGLVAEAARRAVTCGHAMQGAMKEFGKIAAGKAVTVSIAAKVAVAAGPARRFRVGDPSIQYLDALAGATVDRLAATERAAKREEVLVDGRTAATIEDAIEARGRRAVPGGGEAVVVARMTRPADPIPWSAIAEESVAEDELAPWVLPAVRERLAARAGTHDALLAELRPAVAIFVGFGGIDYDGDERAGEKLDRFVRWAQGVLTRYEGALIDLTIGDKGSYLFAAFGAPTAHEDDAERALRAVIELRGGNRETSPPDLLRSRETSAPAPLGSREPSPPAPLPQGERGEERVGSGLRIGVSGGRTRAGTVGAPTRRAYTVTGTDVNVAARLMERAKAGETLVSEHVFEATRGAFVGRALGAIELKGSSKAVRVVALDGVKGESAAGTDGRCAGVPAATMVGRAGELAGVVAAMDRAARGAGQLVAITAVAGIGKSRLLAEVVREAKGRGFAVYTGEAQSFGRATTYLAWHNVWRGLLGFDGNAGATAEARAEALGDALGKIDGGLVARLPLLGAAVGVAIPDNELTRQFEAKLRKDSLEALLTTCLRARAAEGPVVIAIEDAHWMDALSVDLLESIGRAVAGMKVLLVVTSRTEEGDAGDAAVKRLAPLPHYAETRLRELGRTDASELIARSARARLGAGAAVPERFLALVHARAEGNPFLAEELVGYLVDRGITPESATTGAAIELPNNVAGAILGRVDRLTTGQQTALKVASVIGRAFLFAWLWGVVPQLGETERVREQLEDLERRELVTREGEGDGGGYAFKHSLIQEVVYESLPFETRERLHETLGRWLEARGDASVDLLAFHFGRGRDVEKKREYLRKAGDAAAARYANEAAAGYYERLVEVVEDGDAEGKAGVLLSLGMAKAAVSKWEEAEGAYKGALGLVEGAAASGLRGRARVALAETHMLRAAYDEALRQLEAAREDFVAVGDCGGETSALLEEANLFRILGRLDEAKVALRLSLDREGPAGDEERIARACHIFGTVEGDAMNIAEAERWYAKALELRRKKGDKTGIARLTINLAVVAWADHRFDDARPRLAETLALCEELGMRWLMARATELSGLILAAEGDFLGARRSYRSALVVLRDLGAMREMAEAMVSMLGTWKAGSDSTGSRYALRVGSAGFALFERLGLHVPAIVETHRTRNLHSIRAALGDAAADEAWAEGQSMAWTEAVDYALEEDDVAPSNAS